MSTSSSAGIRAVFRTSWNRSAQFVYGSSSSSSLSGAYQESVLRLELEPPPIIHDDDEEAKEPIWFAGETLKGVVSYNRRLRGAATSLHLCAYGNERAHIASRPTSSRADRPILHLDTVLCDDLAQQDAGADTDWQEIPFMLELPATLPSSVRVDADAGKSYTSILYKVRAELRSGNVRNCGKYSVVAQCEARVTIQSAPEACEVVPWRMKPTTVEVKQFGVAKLGTVTFGCQVADTHAHKGQTLLVNFASRNNSTVDLDYLELRLLELVTWQAKGRECEQKNVLVDRRCTLSEVMSQDNRGPIRLLAAADQLHEDNNREIFIDLHLRRHVVELMVPDTALDSYKGKVMRVQHILRVRLKTSTLVSDPSVHIPLKIRNYVEQATTQWTPNPAPNAAPAEEDAAENDESAPNDADEEVSNDDAAEGSTPESRPSRRGLRRANADQSVRLMARESLRRSLAAVAERENEAEESQRNLPEEEHEVVAEEEEPSTIIQEPERTPSTRHPLVSVPSFRLVTGGTTILERSIGDGLSASNSRSSISSTDTATMVGETLLAEEEEHADEDATPSLESLLSQMLRSMDDFEIIQGKLEHAEWRDILCALEPDEFADVLAHVHLDFDQVKVAACVASNIMVEGKQPFTCEHVKVAVETSVDWNRCTMVSRLLPFCADVETNRFVILDILEPWELTVTAHDFECALNAT